MKSSAKNSKATESQLVTFFVIILVIIGLTGGVWMWMQKQTQLPEVPDTQTNPVTQMEPTPTPTPTKLFHGKDTYSVSGGTAGKPGITAVTLDPLDPAVGAEQSFTVTLTNGSPITDAYLSIRTDTKTTKIPLTLESGAAQNGTWTGKWTVPETYTYNYIVTAVATGNNGSTSIPITIRERK